MGKTLCTIPCLLTICYLFAQQIPLSFHHLSTAQGLSNPVNSYVYKDSEGFVWISSIDGLNRFDGRNVKVYRPDPLVENTLSGNIISSPFFEDEQTNIWFTSYGSIQCYVRAFDHFLTFQLLDDSRQEISEDYRAFYLDDQHQLWLRTGLQENGLLHVFNIKTLKDSLIGAFDGQRNYLVQDSASGDVSIFSTMFAGKNGLEVTRIIQGEVKTEVYFRGAGDGLPRLRILNLVADNSDLIYFGTTTGMGIFSPFKHDFSFFDDFKGQPLGEVWSVCPLDKTLLLVSSKQCGLLLFDLISESFISSYLPSNKDQFALRSGDPKEVFVDRDNCIWVSIWGEGLDFASLDKNKFPMLDLSHLLSSDVEITGMNLDDSDRIWCSSSTDGILVFDKDQAVVANLDPVKEIGLDPRSRIDLIYLDHDNRIWIILDNYRSGVRNIYYSLDEGKDWIHVADVDYEVTSVCQTQANRIFLSSSEGVKEIIFKEPDDTYVRTVPEFSEYSSLPFYKIFQDRAGLLYFSANFDRILIYQDDQGSLLLQQSINKVGDAKGFAETDSVLWIATSGGLLKVNKPDLQHRFLSQSRDDLPNESYHAVVSDKDNLLWLKSQSALLKYNLQTKTHRKYTLADGVQEDINSQTYYLQKASGEIWLVGSKGITIFTPDKVEDFQTEAQAQITGIYLNAAPLQTDSFVGVLDKLVVPYRDNTVSFDFVACEYGDPSNTRFRYQMTPFDKDWVDGGSLGFARYPNLPSGQYQFKVQAANSDGIWFDNTKILQLNILPPWWDTSWARLIYLVLCGGVLYAFYYWRTLEHRKKLANRERQLKQERKVNERLRKVDQLKDQFLANTSHELRTPLNGIIGLAESLQDGATGVLSEDTKSNLSIITASGKRLAKLVDDILDFSRIKNDDLHLDLKAVDVRSIATLVCTLIKPLADSKHLALKNQIEEHLPLARADENRLQQILFNLVGNAIKFTEKGEVVLQSKIENDYVYISVADTGIGIDNKKFESLFQSFEQVDISDTRSYGGAGLGLAITKQLVELHDGIITVQSKPGIGSTFTFSLPLAGQEEIVLDTIKEFESAADFQVSAIEYEKTIPVPLRGGIVKSEIRILIVDDEPLNLQVLRNHLTLAGYQVVEANSGHAALEMVAENGVFDLVILDIMMPRLSGFDVCQELRKKYLASELPIILLTAKNQISDLVHGFDAGANDYLQKPFSKDELLSRIKTHLRLHRINQATGKFVPYEFLRSIGRDEITEVQLGDHTHYSDISVLFADIRDYTTLSEQMTPEQNFKFVNAFVGRVGPVVELNQGFVDQYLGDAILAIFPKKVDHVLNAAIQMQQVIQEYNRGRIAQGRKPIKIGVGIHTGPLIMGIIGYVNRTDTAIIADTVNIASRFEGLTKYYGANILLSEATMRQIENPGQYHFRYLGVVQVKGKVEPLGVYECLDGDEPASLQNKIITLASFKEAVTHYEKGSFEKASTYLNQVLKQNPDDYIARRLFTKVEQYAKDGAPPDWKGIEMMDAK